MKKFDVIDLGFAEGQRSLTQEQVNPVDYSSETLDETATRYGKAALANVVETVGIIKPLRSLYYRSESYAENITDLLLGQFDKDFD